MQLQYLNSASVVIKSNNIKVLCDPWLKDGAYYGSWCHYPPLEIDIPNYFDVDYIYISHVHPDHLNIETLKLFPKTIPILIHNYEQKFVKKILSMVGFTNIIEIDHKKEFELAQNFTIEILAADNCNPEKCGLFIGCISKNNSGKSQSIDSLAVFKDSKSVLVNTNDCPYDMTTDVLSYINEKYKTVDMLLTGYLGAGPYPQCFTNLKDNEKRIAAKEKENFFYMQAIKYIEKLNPRYFMPFAGKYTLSGKLVGLNQWKGNPEMEDVMKDLNFKILDRNISSKMIVLDREAEVNISDSNLVSNYCKIKKEDKEKYIFDVLSKRSFTYQEEKVLDKNTLLKLLNDAQKRKLHMQSIFDFYSDWNIYLELDKDCLVEVPFHKRDIRFVNKVSKANPWVKIGLSPQALSSTLLRKTHWNNLEIGSHLTFTRNKNEYNRAIHYFLNFFHA